MPRVRQGFLQGEVNENLIIFLNIKLQFLPRKGVLYSLYQIVFFCEKELASWIIMIMKQRQATQKQYHSSKQSPSKLTNNSPSCTIQTFLHLQAANLHQSNSTKNHTTNRNQEKYYPSPNIELSSTQPNKMVFHHFQKFNTFQFQFDHIFDQSAKNIDISNSLSIFHSLLQQGKDVSVMAMGTNQSGMHSLIQGDSSSQNEGLYFTLVSQLWHNIKQQEKNKGVNSIKILLRFVVISDEKLYDLQAPKNEVQLKDTGNKFTIVNCSVYQITSLYEFYQKLMQIYEQKQLLYSQSIMIAQAEMIISKEGHFISDQDRSHRYFTFVEWQKSAFLSSTVKSKENNNQSLLTLNMCIYELYKISCHNPQKLSQNDVKKLWSNFRNSFITMLIKHSFTKNGRFIYFACVSLKESEEQDSFQVLMVAKNMAKIDFSKFIAKDYQAKIKFRTSKENISSKKMKTQPIQAQSFEKMQNIQLSRIKQNLKRILKEKQQSDQLKEKQDEIIVLMKEQKQKKRQLESIRYRIQEIKVKEDINKLTKLNSQNSSRIIVNKQEAKVVNLPTLHLKKASRDFSQEELTRLQKEEEKAIKQIDLIHQRIMENVEEQSNPKLAKNVLEMEIKLHEKQMVEFITNKNKILNLLKQQVSQIKQVKREHINSEKKYEKKVSLKSSTQKRRIKSRLQSPLITIDTKEQQDNPQGMADKQEEKPHKQIFKLQNLKRMNKNNYLFEKRRQILKAKVSKGREQVNQFYEEAAKKFQQYRSK